MLHQKNLWADDCMSREDLTMCFSAAEHGGRVIMENMELSDAQCEVLSQSRSIQSLTDTIKYMKMMGLASEAPPGPALVPQADNRVYVPDSGWISFPIGATWRVINSTLACTGGVTHPLDEGGPLGPVWSVWQILIAVLATVAAAATTTVLWLARRMGWGAGALAKLPEATVAKANGYTLQRLLGVGHYGRVYLAKETKAGGTVAIKVITVYTSGQLSAAYRECQHMMAIRHPNCTRVHTYYCAQMEHSLRPVAPAGSGSSGGYMEQSLQPVDNPTVTLLSPGGSPPTSMPTRDLLGPRNAGSSGSEMSGSTPRTTMAVQVHMVVDYCDCGTLETAVLEGVFVDPETGRLRERWVTETAIEVASALAYLHDPERRFVHRDLSALNVLLRSPGVGANGSADSSAGGDASSAFPPSQPLFPESDRAFTAVVSDFGLSMVLAEHATHHTSQMKGTVAYMSPEVFSTNDITQALDVYSFGIILYFMVAGALPYGDRSPAQIVLEKVREMERSDEDRFEFPAGTPFELKRLVLDCTHPLRRQRPTMKAVIRRLYEIY